MIIGLLWIFTNSFFLFKNGIVTTGEAEKYIYQAYIFAQSGHLSTPNFWLYFVQIALLAFTIKLKLSFAFVVIIQLLFNLIATLYFYSTLQFIFESTSIAVAGTIVLLLNQPYQEFNTFLQTESLFYSFTLIFCCYLIRIKKISFKNLTLIFFQLAVISITRPTGFLFLLAVSLYFYIIYYKELSVIRKISFIIAVSFLFLTMINTAMGSGGEFDFMLPFHNEDIICGAPTVPRSTMINTAREGNSLSGLLFYIRHNFHQFTRLAWLKTIAFFGLYRTYFSRWHNAYLVLYFYTIHFFALAGISYWVKNHLSKFLYFVSVIGMTWATVILTCDDWHNRFYLSISPYLIILSLGYLKMVSKK